MGKTDQEKPKDRPVFVEFMRQKHRTKAYKEKKILKKKGVNIFFNEDLSKDDVALFAKAKKLKQDRYITR